MIEVFLFLKKVARYLTEDFLGGPRPWKMSWIINFQKAGTLFFVLSLMHICQNFTIEAYIYLALHGGYGLVWLIKDLCFPDSGWQKKVTIAGGLMVFFGVLFWYWFMAWLLISSSVTPEYPVDSRIWLAAAVIICLLGCVIMIAADAQKYYTLKFQKGLISEGIHKYIRHPNYLGEMMIYGALAMLVWHWASWVIVMTVWLLVFIPNMVAKERSLSRFPEWVQYKKRSGWLLPKL